MLPGIDDGAQTLETALEMARMAVADGIRTVACTPHIYPGLYENDAAGIRAAVKAFATELANHDIPLELTTGADVHLTPELVADLRGDRIPTLGGTRYFLFEPPHHVAPPRLADSIFEVVAAGYVPIVTHPERLTWIADHYDTFVQLARGGALMQVTAGALTGRFGATPKRYAERLLDDDIVHLIATDAHSTGRRCPALREARDHVAATRGEALADWLVQGAPAAILADSPVAALLASKPAPENRARKGFSWRNLWHRD